jgi:hypothetical protein
MTEARWLSAFDPHPMLESLRDHGSCRKYRLAGCAFCRRVWDLLTDERSRNAVEQAERYADGLISQEVLSAAQVGADRAMVPWDRRNFVFRRSSERAVAYKFGAAATAAKAVARPTNFLSKLASSIREASHFALLAEYGDRYAQQGDMSSHVRIVRCVFGNPFRPVSLEPSWRTSTVVALAEGIYADRAFDRLPILADALMDAGCDNTDVLSHCRSDGPHVRGCWVVDLLTGRA